MLSSFCKDSRSSASQGAASKVQRALLSVHQQEGDCVQGISADIVQEAPKHGCLPGQMKLSVAMKLAMVVMAIAIQMALVTALPAASVAKPGQLQPELFNSRSKKFRWRRGGDGP